MNIRYDAESRIMYNEDGTIYNPPDNVRTVLAEMYPAPSDCSRECYCCNRCGESKSFVVPNEDAEKVQQISDRVRENIKMYHKVHNPQLYNICYE